METTWCPVKEGPKLIDRYMEISFNPLFRNDKEANAIFSKRYYLRDTIDNNTFNPKFEQAYELMRWMDSKTKTMFVDDIKDCARQIAKSMEQTEWVNKWYQTQYISDMMKYKWGYDVKLIDNIKYLEDLFMKKWYTPYKVFASMSPKEWLTDIYNNIKGSLRYAFLLHEGVSAKNLSAWLLDFWKSKWMSDAAAKRFVDDMQGSPLLTKERQQRIGSMKSMYSFLKFTPLVAPVSWTFNLLNNTLLGSMMFLSKRRGLEWMLRSDTVDYLLDREWFLGSESRANNITQAWFDQDGKNFFNRTMDKIFSVIPDTKWWERLNTFIQWWVHNIRDMVVENSAKRLSITEALSKNGINKNNMDIFLKNIKDGTIAPEFMLKIRWDAALAWKQFFTTWEISSLNRNRFSKMWYINTLQNYVINRADDVWSWVRKAYQDFRKNPKRVRWDFSRVASSWQGKSGGWGTFFLGGWT